MNNKIDRRRKHRHFQVTVFYHDGEKFARTYLGKERAEKAAERMKRSPVVEKVSVQEVNEP